MNASSCARSALCPVGITSPRVGVGPPMGDDRRERRRHLVAVDVDHERAEVLFVDGAPGLRGGGLDDRPARGGIVGRAEARQPAVTESPGAPQLRGRGAAEPHVWRLLQWLGANREGLEGEVLAFVVDAVLHPEPADQRQRLVEPAGAILPLHGERLLLRWIGDAQPERGQRPADRTGGRGWPTPWPPVRGCGRAAPAHSSRASAWSCVRPRTRDRRADRVPSPWHARTARASRTANAPSRRRTRRRSRTRHPRRGHRARRRSLSSCGGG